MNGYGARHIPFLAGIDFELNRAFFIPNPIQNQDILWKINDIRNYTHVTDLSNQTPTIQIISADDKVTYSKRFKIIKDGMMRGDSFLTNLTVTSKIDSNLSIEEIFYKSNAKYKLLIPEEFVCFSPEPFIKISDNKIYAYPMKGTIDATLPNAEKQLIDDYKEQCEHFTIVDLLRNDLSKISTNVRVKKFRYVEHVFTLNGEILQTSSEIEGRLTNNWHEQLGDIILSLLPAGSVSGAPKQATLQLIREAESGPRGWYCGIFGYYDGSSFDSAVMIRCISQKKDNLYFHSGGGITINSQESSEYNEVLQKIYIPIK
jgi:para-aminobenzoate synthetase component 1